LVLAHKICDGFGRERAKDNSVAQIHHHHVVNIPPRAGVGRDRHLAV
jgi:hypothetical protein